MAFERATPPALRWVLAFLGICAALGLYMGFKDQIRRNPPAWYTGAPDPVIPGAPATDADRVREATPFDPSVRTASQQAESAATTELKKPEAGEKSAQTASADQPASDAAGASPAAPGATPTMVAPPAARPKAAAAQPARPAPPADPVGDILEGQRPQPQPTTPADVPY